MNNLSTTDRLQDLLPQLFSNKKYEGNYYLKFQLTSQINALLDLKYVQESKIIDSTQITSIPNLPEYVVGMMSCRNRVFLAVDLAHLVGFIPQTINLRQYQTIIVDNSQDDLPSAEAHLYGLTVRKIQGITRILPEQFNGEIASAPDILCPFVQSFVELNPENHDSAIPQRTFLIDLPQLIGAKIQS